uniref:Uncharacterized protein n=1 Tax=Anguilla anguilla TaxID=7936 RepID=A0A0E9R2K1_ANGAN
MLLVCDNVHSISRTRAADGWPSACNCLPTLALFFMPYFVCVGD